MADITEKTPEEVSTTTDESIAKAENGADVEKKTVDENEKLEPSREKLAAGEDNNSAAAEDKSAEAAAEEEKFSSVSESGAASKKEKQIIHQMEYYFGDANLNRDKFLLEQISKDKDGWVPLSVMLSFKRLAALTTDVDVIVNSLYKSDEGLVEVSEDKLKVRRHPERPVPEQNEERRKELMTRTAYVKGFPLDAEMSEIIEFFSPYEKVANIAMRKYLDKPTKTYKFKGSVFITFAKKEQTEELINKDKVEYKERELIRKWQKDYLEGKKEERNKKSKGKPVEEDKFILPKGTVLHFEGAADTTTREMIREAIENLEGGWDVAYIDFSKGEKAGFIRLSTENTASDFLAKLENKKLKLSSEDDATEITLRKLEEDEEKAFLDKAIQHMKSRRTQQSRNKGGHHHHHHHGNRKRRSGGGNHGSDKKKKNDE